MPAHFYMNTEDKEEKIILAKALDELDKCQRENRICYTDFLDMRMQGLLENEIRYCGTGFLFDGGYDTAERRMFGLRQVLAERYSDVPGMELYNQVRLSI